MLVRKGFIMVKGYVMDAVRYEKSPKLRGLQVKRELVAKILESFFGEGLTIMEICMQTGISVTAVSRYINYGIGKLKSETTDIITLQSKIND